MSEQKVPSSVYFNNLEDTIKIDNNSTSHNYYIQNEYSRNQHNPKSLENSLPHESSSNLDSKFLNSNDNNNDRKQDYLINKYADKGFSQTFNYDEFIEPDQRMSFAKDCDIGENKKLQCITLVENNNYIYKRRHNNTRVLDLKKMANETSKDHFLNVFRNKKCSAKFLYIPPSINRQDLAKNNYYYTKSFANMSSLSPMHSNLFY